MNKNIIEFKGTFTSVSIDLIEVKSIKCALHVPATKKITEHAYLELNMGEKEYKFCFENKQACRDAYELIKNMHDVTSIQIE